MPASWPKGTETTRIESKFAYELTMDLFRNERRIDRHSVRGSRPPYNTSGYSSDRRRNAKWYGRHYDPIKNGSIDGTDVIAHDAGLLRAQRTSYDPLRDPKIKGNAYNTLFVGRLHPRTGEATLREAFSPFGAIKNLRLVRDVVTKSSKGYAFIEYQDEGALVKAYLHMNRCLIDGQPILVEYERERVMEGWKPRRLGGGLGGKKESGQLRFGGRDRPFRAPIAMDSGPTRKSDVSQRGPP